MTKRILTLLLALLLVLSLGACKNSNQDDPPNGDDPAVGDGTSYSDFMEVMGDIKKYGDDSAELNLTAQSEYYYFFAGASVSAFRYAVDLTVSGYVYDHRQGISLSTDRKPRIDFKKIAVRIYFERASQKIRTRECADFLLFHSSLFTFH